MRATIFIGSLKRETDDSNTVDLAQRVKRELEGYGVRVAMRYLRSRRIAPGVEFDTGDEWDEAKVYFRDFERSDIIILATPIWWGIQSSLVQALMERIGAFDDDYIKTGDSKLYNKVFGCIVTGSNDGFQHVQGNLYAFASNLGMTVPPEAHSFWATAVGREDNPVDNAETENMVKNQARNLFMWGKAISDLKLGSRALKVKPGRVGLDANDKLQASPTTETRRKQAGSMRFQRTKP
jgi:multimeric flavodoxin WrbA